MNALLLIGSPKRGKSASRSFGEAILTRLAHRGASTRTDRATPIMRSASAAQTLTDALEWADLVILSFPVYVDTLPAPVTRALEMWAEARATRTDWRNGRPQRLVVLTQCGFPEPKHCDIAVEVGRQFCRETGVAWAGALAFGMGGAIEGRPVEKSPLARSLAAFDEAADALVAGLPIPETATQALRRQLTPSWTYTMFGGVAWWWVSRRRGNRESLRLRRYPQ